MTISVVYIFTNAGLPGARKIGRTVRGADRRAAEVTKAYGTIHPFVVESKHVVTNPNAVEAIAHRLLRKRRVKNTEIFYVSKERAQWAVRAAAKMAAERSSWLRAWHWLVLRPHRESVKRYRRHGHGTELFMATVLALALSAYASWAKPELPDWLPTPVRHVAEMVERLN